MALVTRAYIEEKLRRAKSAIIDAESALSKMEDDPDNPTFIRIPHDCELDVNTKFAVGQLNAARINVEKD